ncbi:MAG: heavy-metal-associated domain-containing protein [Bacteroidales bacterium]|jgi:Cu+-exporting ATPase|nr:heavy-metal-associated domain-containing protein [Bacteroidales bacterium]
MKKILTLCLMALLTFAIGFQADAAGKKQKKVAEVTFVTTIDCKNCVKKVEANLPYEKGILDMKVKLDDQTVWVKYNPEKTTIDKLIAAINKLGYDAKVAEPAAAK